MHLAKLRYGETGQNPWEGHVPGIDGSGDSYPNSTRAGIVVRGSNGSKVYPPTLGFPMFPAPGKVVNQEMDMPLSNPIQVYDGSRYASSMHGIPNNTVDINTGRNMVYSSGEAVPVYTPQLDNQLPYVSNQTFPVDYSNQVIPVDYSNQNISDYCQNVAFSGQNMSNYIQSVPNYGHNNEQVTSYGDSIPTNSENVNNYVSSNRRLMDNYQTAPVYAQDIPAYSQNVPVQGQAIPSYDNDAAQYGINPTNYANSFPVFWQNQPNYGHYLPSNEYAAPAYDINIDSYGIPVSNYVQNIQKSVLDVPNYDDTIDTSIEPVKVTSRVDAVVKPAYKQLVDTYKQMHNPNNMPIEPRSQKDDFKTNKKPGIVEKDKDDYSVMQSRFQNMMVKSSSKDQPPSAIPSLLSIVTTPFVRASDTDKQPNSANDGYESSLPSLESYPISWASNSAPTRRNIEKLQKLPEMSASQVDINGPGVIAKDNYSSFKSPPGLFKTPMGINFAEVTSSNSDYSIFNPYDY